MWDVFLIRASNDNIHDKNLFNPGMFILGVFGPNNHIQP